MKLLLGEVSDATKRMGKAPYNDKKAREFAETETRKTVELIHGPRSGKLKLDGETGPS